MDRHQGESTTSQLGWHPDELPSYTAKLKFIKKRGEIQEGGLGQNPQKRKQKNKNGKNSKKQPPTEI